MGRNVGVRVGAEVREEPGASVTVGRFGVVTGVEEPGRQAESSSAAIRNKERVRVGRMVC